MRLTRFTDYSLRVLIYLGQNTQDRVTIHQISEAYDISKNHLMKVVSNLTRLRIVVAQRGPGGGIQLNRAPEDINLREVIRNTERHLNKVDNHNSQDTMDLSAETRLNSYLHHALLAYLDTLGNYTLSDILQSAVEIDHMMDLKENTV